MTESPKDRRAREAIENLTRQLVEANDQRDKWKEQAEKAERRASRESEGFRVMCEAFQRLEEIVGLDTGGGMGPGPALNTVERIMKERDALAAYASAMQKLWFDIDDCETESDEQQQLISAMFALIRDNHNDPNASLAQRDARVIADTINRISCIAGLSLSDAQTAVLRQIEIHERRQPKEVAE